MWPTHTFQKHVCAFFISCVLVVTLITIKNKSEHNSNFRNGTDKTIYELSKLAEGKFNWKANSTGFHYSRRVDGGDGDDLVHILGLFELTTKWGERMEGRSEIAAAQLAIQHINNLDILPGYTIKLLTNDTKCDPGVGIDTFFHAIYSKKTIVMLLGTSCSNVTESLAHVVPYWNILQISFGSTSPSLSDRKKFPLFFRTIAPDSSHDTAKIRFVKNFGWKVVATFCQSENEFLLPLNNLISELESENISCVTTITFSFDNYKEQLKALKDSDIRIVIGSFSAEIAPRIFCEVYRLDMYGTDYVWILQDRQKTWWKSPSDCSPQELEDAVEGLIIISDYNTVSENDTTISGLDHELFEKELKMPKRDISKYASLTYDAIWTIALTLRNVQLSHGSPHFRDFNYKNKPVADELVRQMSSLNFIGVSGPVKFVGADRIGSSLLQQLQGGEIAEIAVYDSNKDRLDFRCKGCREIGWQQVPIAQRILKVSPITIPKTVLYLTILVSAMGIATSFVFLYFNLHYRRMKTVKLSSPKLNNVAVLGCILVYVYVILLGFDTSMWSLKYFSEFCTARVYLLSAGFSLAFGSMFAKTYRIHRIFAYYGGTTKVTDKLLKDKQLIVLILTPLAIDAIILALWIMIDPMERQLYNLTLQINAEDRGVVYQPQVEVCRSQNTTGWFIALYGYKGLVLIMGVFMAWETRHVKVQALNDSQYIGICVYSAVFSAIITTVSSLVSEYVLFTYLAKTGSIVISASLTLFLLLVPKLKSVFNNCQDPIMESMGLKFESKTRRFITDDSKEQICRLEIQNRVYKCKLEALNSEIARLEGLCANVEVGATELFTIFKDDCGGWGSWPLTNSRSKSEFLSDCRLHETPVPEENSSFKCRVSDVASEISPAMSRVLLKRKQKSFPEIQNKLVVRGGCLIKTKSEAAVAPDDFYVKVPRIHHPQLYN